MPSNTTEPPKGRKAFTFELATCGGPHIVNDDELFVPSSLKVPEGDFQLAIDGNEYSRVMGKGTLEVFLRCGQDWHLVTLEDVHYIPSVERNMLSRNRLNRDLFEIRRKDKHYQIVKGETVYAEAYKSKIGGGEDTVGTFNMGNPVSEASKHLKADDVASFLGISPSDLDKQLGVTSAGKQGRLPKALKKIG